MPISPEEYKNMGSVRGLGRHYHDFVAGLDGAYPDAWLFGYEVRIAGHVEWLTAEEFFVRCFLPSITTFLQEKYTWPLRMLKQQADDIYEWKAGDAKDLLESGYPEAEWVRETFETSVPLLAVAVLIAIKDIYEDGLTGDLAVCITQQDMNKQAGTPIPEHDQVPQPFWGELWSKILNLWTVPVLPEIRWPFQDSPYADTFSLGLVNQNARDFRDDEYSRQRSQVWGWLRDIQRQIPNDEDHLTPHGIKLLELIHYTRRLFVRIPPISPREAVKEQERD